MSGLPGPACERQTSHAQLNDIFAADHLGAGSASPQPPTGGARRPRRSRHGARDRSDGRFGRGPAEQYHAHVTDSFSDQICGIGVDVDLVATDNFSVYEDGSVKDTGSFRATITNPVNGNSVVLSGAGQVRVGAPIVDEQAGTITFQPTFKGLPGKIQTANGAVLLRDAGLLTRTDTIDLETGQLLASETLVSHGPHPEVDSDYTRSCEVITQALA